MIAVTAAKLAFLLDRDPLVSDLHRELGQRILASPDPGALIDGLSVGPAPSPAPGRASPTISDASRPDASRPDASTGTLSPGSALHPSTPGSEGCGSKIGSTRWSAISPTAVDRGRSRGPERALLGDLPEQRRGKGLADRRRLPRRPTACGAIKSTSRVAPIRPR